jgi:lipopolysaccharide export LptBFGC system permease protein LptF
MKIVNKTKYDTKKLRKLFCFCQREEKILSSTHWKRLRVEVKSRTQIEVKGKAIIGGYNIWMYLPNYNKVIKKIETIEKHLEKNNKWNDNYNNWYEHKLSLIKENKEKLTFNVCWVFIHELLHVKGLKHRDFKDESIKYRVKGYVEKFNYIEL